MRSEGSARPLRTVQHWVFDMDGTLTLAIHDFDAIRRELGLPMGRNILEALGERDPADRVRLERRLDEIERELARKAEPQPGAFELLGALRARGARLGILTRNSRPNAFETLRAAGLAGFFDADCVLGRDEAPPKPSPVGLLQLCASWGAEPRAAAMVGDYLYDLETGRSAGATTVYFDPSGVFDFSHLADHRIRHLGEILVVESSS